MRSGLLMKAGFTIVELTLSIAFIGILSLTVFLLISNSVSSYHRGLTLNQINTVGMGVVDDMRSAVQASPGRFSARTDCESVYPSADQTTSTCIGDGALSFVYIERYGNVEVTDGSTIRVPLYGAFCTGAYSYIWNSGYFFNSEDYRPQSVQPAIFTFRNTNGNIDTRQNFKLLKVADDNRAVCKAAAGAVGTAGDNGTYQTVMNAQSSLGNNFDVGCNTVSAQHRPTDICGEIDGNTIETDLVEESGSLALYDLSVAKPAESTGTNNLFYSVSFILATTEGGINVKSTTGNYCTTPEDYSNPAVENFDYCAINKFNFAAQATGG